MALSTVAGDDPVVAGLLCTRTSPLGLALARTGTTVLAMSTGDSVEEARAVAFRAAEGSVSAVARAVSGQLKAIEIHRRAADLHGRAAEFYSTHARLDRLAGHEELAARLDRRAEHESVLEAEELRRADAAPSRKAGSKYVATFMRNGRSIAARWPMRRVGEPTAARDRQDARNEDFFRRTNEVELEESGPDVVDDPPG